LAYRKIDIEGDKGFGVIGSVGLVSPPRLVQEPGDSSSDFLDWKMPYFLWKNGF